MSAVAFWWKEVPFSSSFPRAQACCRSPTDRSFNTFKRLRSLTGFWCKNAWPGTGLRKLGVQHFRWNAFGQSHAHCADHSTVAPVNETVDLRYSPTAKLRIRPFSKGCRESGTNLIFLHRWGGKVDSRRFTMVVWDERCPFSCFRHFFGFGCHNHGNSLPMYVAPARRWSPVHSRRLHVLRRSFAKLIERRECVLFPSP